MTMDAARKSGHPPPVSTAQVESVMAASRVLIGISAQSLAAVEDSVTLPQFRILVILDSRGPIGLAALATAMGVHPSNATRACDRLVALGLLTRRDNPDDRRYLALELTESSHQLIDTVMSLRRRAIEAVLQRLAPVDRDRLGHAMGTFALAGDEPDPQHLWALGWTTQAPPPKHSS